MRKIFVLAEHRRGEIRNITFEMLTKGKELAEKTNTEITAVLLGKNVKEHAKTLSEYAKRVLLIKDEKLENFNSDAYQIVLSHLIRERKPMLTLIAHTSYGLDLAPSLAISLNLPLATDCIDLEFENETLTVTREMYGGKVNVKAVLRKAESYLVTVRQATFQAKKEESMNGEIVKVPSPLKEEITEKQFIKYVLPPPSDVDITAIEIIVGIGRGIKDASDIPVVEELAKTLGGVLACSRPIVDKGWLPSNRQIGISGKTIKPKLYIALGISGSIQHVTGMKNSGLIIAVNIDLSAPIFRYANYGIVKDLYKVVPKIIENIKKIKRMERSEG